MVFSLVTFHFPQFIMYFCRWKMFFLELKEENMRHTVSIKLFVCSVHNLFIHSSAVPLDIVYANKLNSTVGTSVGFLHLHLYTCELYMIGRRVLGEVGYDLPLHGVSQSIPFSHFLLFQFPPFFYWRAVVILCVSLVLFTWSWNEN